MTPRLSFWASFGWTWAMMALVLIAIAMPMVIADRWGKLPSDEGILIGAVSFALVLICAAVYFLKDA